MLNKCDSVTYNIITIINDMMLKMNYYLLNGTFIILIIHINNNNNNTYK